MRAKESERLFACQSEVARLAVDGENRAAGLRIHAFYRTFDAAVEHVRAIDVVAHESDLPVREYAAVDPWELARSELAVALAVHANRAGAMLDLAIALVERCPAILVEIEAGRIDERTASEMVNSLRGITDDDLCRKAAELATRRYVESLESGSRPGLGQLRRMMDRAVRQVDADGVARRRNEANRGRGVWIRKAQDGMASVSARLSAAGAEILAERLDQMAGTGSWSRDAGVPASPRASSGEGEVWNDDEVRNDDEARNDDDDEPSTRTDDRCPDERRADALVDLATAGPDLAAEQGADQSEDRTAEHAAGPTSDQSEDRTAEHAAEPTSEQSEGRTAGQEPDPAGRPNEGRLSTDPLRPHVTVIMTGDGDSEVIFRRSGESSLAALKELLSRARGATFETVYTGHTSIDQRAALKYSIPGWLARRIRLRDGTCRHPGCSVAAERCDVDHVIPFLKVNPAGGGPTAEWNLICLCRTHHRLKTFSGWRYTVNPAGVLDVVTETGRTVRTWPSGPLARARMVEHAVDAESEADHWPDAPSQSLSDQWPDPLGQPFASRSACPGNGPVHVAGRCDCGALRVDSAPGEVSREPTHSDGSPRGAFIGFRYTTRERRRRARLQSERDLLGLQRRARREVRRAKEEADHADDPPPF